MSVEKDLDKLFGEVKEEKIGGFLDTGFAPLNFIMTGKKDGGFAYGRIAEIFGPSSSGKTALALQTMIEAQKHGGIAIFLDHERAFDINLAKHNGLNIDRPWFLYMKPRTWEESNMKMMQAAEMIRKNKLIPEEAPIVSVLDSIAAAVPQSVIEKGITEHTMNDTTALARAVSDTIKKINVWTEEFNVCAIYLNQTRIKPGVVYGDPVTTPGGQAMEFYATVRLALSRAKVTEGEGKDKETVGQLMTVECRKSKLTAPFKKTKMMLKFNEDGSSTFDMTASLIEVLCEDGKLESAKGKGVLWSDGKYYPKKKLAEKIDAEGLTAELSALF